MPHNVSGYVLYQVPQFSRSLPRLTKDGAQRSGCLQQRLPIHGLLGLGSTDTGSHTGNTLDRADLWATRSAASFSGESAGTVDRRCAMD